LDFEQKQEGVFMEPLKLIDKMQLFSFKSCSFSQSTPQERNNYENAQPGAVLISQL